MFRGLLHLVSCVTVLSFGSAALSQDAESDEALSNEDGKATIADPDECFVMPAVLDMNVLTDQHIYINTRGGNHYLMTTVRQCRNLQRAYRRDQAVFVPYGRRVCQNDGSYIRYYTGTRMEPCPIMSIEAIDDRAHADAIIAGDQDLSEVEVIEPPE